MAEHEVECYQCEHRIDNENGTWVCELYPEEGVITEENAPRYTFHSHRGTGYPDYLCCDCEDIEWIKYDDDCY